MASRLFFQPKYIDDRTLTADDGEAKTRSRGAITSIGWKLSEHYEGTEKLLRTLEVGFYAIVAN